MLPVKQPKPNIKAVPEGFLLLESNSISTTKLIIESVANFTKIAVILGLFIQAIRMSGISQIISASDSFIVRLFLVVVAIFILGIIYNWAKSLYITIDQILVNMNFDPPELIFTNYPLSLGEDASILFRQRRRSGKIIPISGTVNARLTCDEDITYGDDDDTLSFASENVLMRQLPEILVPEYETAIEVIFNFKIPLNAPVTFEAKNNQINWILDVSVDFPQLLKQNSKFYLQVQPQVFLAK